MVATVIRDPLCDDDRVYYRVKDIPEGFNVVPVIEKIDPASPDPVVTMPEPDLICVERGSDDCAGYILNTTLSAA